MKVKFTKILILMLAITFFYAIPFSSYADNQEVMYLTDLMKDLDEEWEHHKFIKETNYSLVTEEGKLAIRAIGQQSASGLYKDVDYSLKEYPIVEWDWKIEEIQKTADLRVKEKEDMGLGVFIIFPNRWIPWKTRVLAYVWVSDKHNIGDVIPHPQHPYFVLQVGDTKKGYWITERRNVLEDYKAVYGEYPDMNVENIAIFTDNDQTLEPVSGFYGPIRVLKK